jgi:threonine dehydratase
MGVRATIVIPDTAPQIKVDGILALGAEVVKCKLSERHAIAKQLSEQQGLTIIHPYDDYDVIAGQGTVGVEIMAALPDLDCVVVPIGGGGLIGGISTAVKAINPKVKVIGAEPSAMPRYTKSVEAGRRVIIEESPCIADALLTLQPGEKNFPIFQSNVDGLAAVKDEFIIQGMKALLFEGRLLAEPSSAVGIGAALQGDLKVSQEDKVCFVVSGGSVGPSQVLKILGGNSC